jgi:hypothetical protein
MGFTFDDGTNEPAANSVSEMRRLTAPEHPQGTHNATRIKPYLGGEEVNDSPTHAHRRWAIDFEDFPLRREPMTFTWEIATQAQRDACFMQGRVPLDYPGPVAEDWPEIAAIVRDRVKPERDRLDGSTADGARRKRLWWRMGRETPALSASLRGQSACMAISRVTPNFTIARLPATTIFAETTVVFATGNFAHFALFQSRVHEVWARFFSSSLEDRLRYGPSDCLETFPTLPDHALVDSMLFQAGQAFHDARAARMVAATEGLTATHNRLDDPEERDPTIVHLRTLHDEMDRAVLHAYGWPYRMPDCVHEREWPGGEDDPPGPWRRRWPEADRARLLEFLWQLNEAEAATQGGPGPPPGASRRGRRPRGPGPTPLPPAPLLEAI